MNNKQTAEALKKKANELLALADKISPPIQKASKAADSKSDSPANPKRKTDWLDEQNKGYEQLLKGKQLSGG